METKIPSFPVRDYDQAKRVFKHAMARLESARQFFTLDERCSDHIGCVLDQAQLYANLIPFEPEIENRCRMMRRRIDLLEGLAAELNPQYYLHQCRRLWYELGDIYSQQISLKMAQHEINWKRQQEQQESSSAAEEKPTTNNAIPEVDLGHSNRHAIKKINHLASNCILHYHRFLSSFPSLNPAKSGRVKEISSLREVELYRLPERLGEDVSYVKPILTGYASIGKTYLKLVASGHRERLSYWGTAQRYYQQLEGYVGRNDDHRRDHFAEYWPHIEEMLKMMPVKMEQIAAMIE